MDRTGNTSAPDASSDPQASWRLVADATEEVEGGTPGTAPAGTAMAEAEAFAEVGRQAVRRDDFDAAYRAFKNAFDRSQHYAFAGSLAVVEMKLGLYADAATHWEFFLKHMDDRASEKRAAVTAQLRACRKQLGRLAVATNEPGAVLLVDGKVVGPLPRNVWLSAGGHQLVARLEHRSSEAVLVDIVVGEARDVRLELPSPPRSAGIEPAASAELPPVRSQPRPGASRHPDFGTREYVLLAGAALTVAGLVTSGYGLWKVDSLTNEMNTLVRRIDIYAEQHGHDPDRICSGTVRDRPDDCARLHDVEWRRDQMQTFTTVALVSSGVVGVATGLGYFLWPRSTSEPVHAQSQSRQVAVSSILPWATRASAGVGLTLQWRWLAARARSGADDLLTFGGIRPGAGLVEHHRIAETETLEQAPDLLG
ncbi:MAG: hypothetical protein JW940_39595 [Polyangiaceae bacterium]|nr:hypothetical protein [Polyangiaceae bacterium]